MKAIIFDFDGVIVDSEKYWDVLFEDAFHSTLPGWNADSLKELNGRSVERTYEYLRDHYGVTCTLEEYRVVIEGTIERIYEEKVKPMPGIIALLERLVARNILLGVSTSSEERWAVDTLDRLGLRQYFPIIVTAKDVPGKTKPDPAGYVLVARRLNVPAKLCVAIEDSRNGIASAKAAGMYCIGLHSEWNDREQLAQADEIIGALDELTDDRLSSLLR